MPVIKVWCLPKEDEERLRYLHQVIVKAVVGVEELGLKDENDMTVLFPSDMMSYGLGSEIIIEVSGLFEKPERTDATFNVLAANLGASFKWLYPNAKIECFVSTFNPVRGFWSTPVPNSANGPRIKHDEVEDELTALWVKNIDRYLESNPIQRQHACQKHVFYLTAVRKQSTDKLPHTNHTMRTKLEHAYRAKGWADAEFYSGGKVVFIKEGML